MAKRKVRIIVNAVGAFPGMTRGDVVEDPTEAQLAYARANPSCFSIQDSIQEEKASPSKGGREDDAEVKENGGNPSKVRRHRKDFRRDE